VVTEKRISLTELVMAVSQALDLVSPSLVNHHRQVAYVALAVSEELGLSEIERYNLAVAGALHDAGALSLKERLDALNFEMESQATANQEKSHLHAEVGYRLLKTFKPFEEIARIVRHHHVLWHHGEGRLRQGLEVHPLSNVLFLADRVSVLVRRDQDILGQSEEIRAKIAGGAGEKFQPEAVDAFLKASARESFWLDLVFPELARLFPRLARTDEFDLNSEIVAELALFFSRLVDFRSSFTACHSSGVAASAETLAGLAGFSRRERAEMRLAGYLHDLGKLVIPKEILEKPGPLTAAERNLIKSHTYHTYHILEPIPALSKITLWASLHHERLDGGGYPFRYHDYDLPLGSRIMSVADVLTALGEDRPYRKGMSSAEVLGVLRDMAAGGALDIRLVELAGSNYAQIDDARVNAQQAAQGEYAVVEDYPAGPAYAAGYSI